MKNRFFSRIFPPESFSEPFLHFKNLRNQRKPIRYKKDVWAIFEYDTCKHILTNREAIGNNEALFGNMCTVLDQDSKENVKLLSTFLPLLEGPYAHKIRSLLTKSINKATGPNPSKNFEDILNQNLNNIPIKDKKVDIYSKIIVPTFSTSFAQLLGIEQTYYEELTFLLTNMHQLLDEYNTATTPDAAKFLQSKNLWKRLKLITLEIFKQARKESHTLVHDILTLGVDKGWLTVDAAISLVAFLFIAMKVTLVSSAGSGLIRLSKHPDQFRLLTSGMATYEQAIDEILRIDPPLHYVRRHVKNHLKIKNANLSPGDIILICIGSANRDEKIFTEPDEFLITREKKGNLTFAIGPHHCLGAKLARTWLKAFFQQLYKYFDYNAPEIINYTQNTAHTGINYENIYIKNIKFNSA